MCMWYNWYMFIIGVLAFAIAINLLGFLNAVLLVIGGFLLWGAFGGD